MVVQLTINIISNEIFVRRIKVNKYMKAVGYERCLPISDDDSLQDVELNVPEAKGNDILVAVKAISVNPVDYKIRQNRSPKNNEWEVLGWDVAGIIESVGPDVENFKLGDDVFYAGSLTKPGANSEYHLVDERLVGKMPDKLNYAESAALPLTTITAWEMLFDRLNINHPTPQGGNIILVIGGAGGVGSITIQLLRALTNMTVVATASRHETQAWVKECGAHHVIDHSQNLVSQFESLGLGAPGFVFSTTHTSKHFNDIVELIAPQGRLGLIDDPDVLDVMPLKSKAISLHWEFMFARSMYNTPDVMEQSNLLNEAAKLVDSGRISSTTTEVIGKINAANLRTAHAKIESGTTRGKIVLEEF